MPPINNRCCAFLQDKLQFSDEINDSVYRKLKEENLKTSKFNIIHFRLGDQNSFSDHGENLEDLYKDCLLKCFLTSSCSSFTFTLSFSLKVLKSGSITLN